MCGHLTQKHKKTKIEQVQGRAARCVPNNYFYNSRITAMLNHFQWPTMEYRRNISQVTMLYRISHHLVAIVPNLYLVQQPFLISIPETPIKFNIKHSQQEQVTLNSVSFLHGVILWNSLQYTIVCDVPWVNLKYESRVRTSGQNLWHVNTFKLVICTTCIHLISNVLNLHMIFNISHFITRCLMGFLNGHPKF